ncbi:MAG TPA: M56 family metallopeptidase [Armatimonadota bacterium]
MAMLGDLLLHPYCRLAGWALLHSLWQGALVALALGLLLAALRRAPAPRRYLAACGALVVLALLPVLTLGTLVSREACSSIRATREGPHVALILIPPQRLASGGMGADQGAQAAAAPAGLQEGGWRSRLERIAPWLTLAWAAGVALLSLRLTGGLVRVRTLALRGTEEAGPELLAQAAALGSRMGLRRPFSLRVSTELLSPIALGVARAVVLLPASALSGLPAEQLQALLAHELAHVRRHDYLANLLQTAVETLLFYHPAVWWVSRHIRLEREHCCDDLAAAAAGGPIVYARALASLEELRMSAPSLAMGAGGGDLLSRVRRLLEGPAARPAPGAALGTLLITLALAAGLLTAAPTVLARLGAEEAKKMTAQTDHAVLEKVPEIGYNLHLNPFSGTLYSLLQYVKEPVPYEMLMGVTGAAFRRTWDRDDGGNVDLMYFAPEPDRRAFRYLNYDYKRVDHADKAGMIAAIQESIARGMPVISFGIIGPPEAGLITGYSKGGEVLHGYSYFQWDKSQGYYEMPNWFEPMSKEGQGLIVVTGKRKTPPPSVKQTLISSLEWAVKLSRAKHLKEVTGPNRNGDHLNGLAAYDGWADGLEKDADYPSGKEKVLATRVMVHCDQCTMLHERHEAAKYLRRMAEAAPEAAKELKAAADLYDQAASEGETLWPFKSPMESRETQEELAKPALRHAMAKHIRAARDKETQALAHVEAALALLKR